MTESELSLQEQLLLLCLNDETGIFEGPYMSYGLNAAALADLLLRDRITLNAEIVLLKNAAPIGDPALDPALERFAARTRTYKLSWWIRCLYDDITVPRESLMANLVRRGILQMVDGRFLWSLHRNVYPTANPAPEQRLRQQVRDAVQTEDAVESYVAVLVALLQASQALDLVVSNEERARRRERIHQLCLSDPIGYAVGKATADVIAEDDGVRHPTTSLAFALDATLLTEAVVSTPVDLSAVSTDAAATA